LSKPRNKWVLKDWLHNLETRNTQEIQLGLTRIMAIAHTLQLQVPDCKVIIVGGTNGKGSTVTALETIYHTAGYRVGAYTSPHLIQFNERIRVNLIPISDSDLCQAFNILDEARGQTILTYFEMVTLAALWYFKKKNLDIIILEVGLGGRLDATNIIDADLSIITTIDFDHQDYLGTTLEAIAYEKAGILRQGKPFIYADTNPPLAITDVSRRLSAPAYFFANEFAIVEQKDDWSIHYSERQIHYLPKPKIQLKSAAAAKTASHLLQEILPVTDDDLQRAMQLIHIPGRLQLHEDSVSVVYDVAHNPQAARLLAEFIIKFVRNKSNAAANGECSGTVRVHAVFSALKDKDIFGLILPLKDCVDHWYPAQLDNKRAASALFLCSKFRDAEISVDICYNSPLVAFETALNRAEPGDLIVVYGSFFTVNYIMAAKPNRRFDEIGNG